MQVRPLRRFRATVIPDNVLRDEAELKADQGVLPFVQFKATDSGRAALIANAVTGLPVLRVDRIEGVPA